MAWLGSWSKRREITVSNTNIDSDLTHFPLPVFINSSSGTGNKDLTPIFDEVGANSLKIAITKSDGTTQIYGEIEKWDDVGEEAFVWVSKSDLTFSSSGNTTLYIYYDNSQPDNTTWIALNGSRTEVWDSDFEGVWHLPELSGTRTDSTSNNNDLTDNNTVGSGTGQIDGAGDFELSNSEYLSRADNASLSITGDITIDLIVKHETLPAEGTIQGYVTKWSGSGTAQRSYYFALQTQTGPIHRLLFSTTDDGVSQDSHFQVVTISAGTNIHLSVIKDTTNDEVKFFIDGSQVGSTRVGIQNSIFDGNRRFIIGSYESNDSPANFMDGIIDEVQVSSSVRSDDWIKANYNAGIDNLASYGDEELMPSAQNSNFFLFMQ